MLLRICLALAILAGLGVIGVSQFMLRPHVQEIIDVRDKNKQEWDKADKTAKQLKKDLTKTTADLDDTKKKLTDTEGARDSALAKFSEEQKRANGLLENVNKLSGDLKTKDQELSAWKNLGIPVEQVLGHLENEKKVVTANEAIEAEKRVLVKEIGRLTNQIDVLLGRNSEEPPPLPAGLRGSVLAVDPKWNFVVLDVGANRDVKEKGVMLVARNGKLVAKVRIVNVQAERCIANIVPGWKLDEILEGDSVLVLNSL